LRGNNEKIHQSLINLCVILAVVMLSMWKLPVEAESGSQSEFDAQTLDAYISGQMSKHGIQGISSR
jgi:hypothetical protein